jgi:hypothetical protein
MKRRVGFIRRANPIRQRRQVASLLRSCSDLESRPRGEISAFIDVTKGWEFARKGQRAYTRLGRKTA